MNLDQLSADFASRVERHLAAMGPRYLNAAIALAVVESFTLLQERAVQAALAGDDDALGQALAEGDLVPKIADTFINLAETRGNA